MDNLFNRYIVKPGTKVKLSDFDPDDTAGMKDKKKAKKLLKKTVKKLDDLQYLLYAEHKHALLVVFQAIDAGGKDGTIRKVLGKLNPQGVRVSSFKQPSDVEKNHDYLWRIHKSCPALGMIHVFNRSHYEDVLVVRVHDLVPRKIWSKRYDQINSFENILAQNNTTILKFFLHISKAEQKRRFQRRIDLEEKHWKLSEADMQERTYWNKYTKAYEAVLSKCSTGHAPWFVIPSNNKWFRNVAISQIIRKTLEDLNMKFPEPTVDPTKITIPG